jgi:phosphatidylglycerol:prolipoprotein diacylglycerol transferase
MRPVLLQIGDITLFSYTVFLDLALLLGLWAAYSLARRYRLPHQRVLDAALWGVVGGLVGARLHFVLANWDYYAVRTGEIAQFWQGGMSFGGGLITGLAAVWLFARVSRTSFWDLVDPIAPALSLASSLAWIGNLLAGSAYGKPGRGFGYGFLPDIFGYIEYRFATQAAAAVAYIAIFALCWWALHRRPWPGFTFTAYLLLTGASQFALEFTRGDDTLVLGGLRLAQWLDIAAMLVGLALVILLMRRRDSAVESEKTPSEEVPLE